MPSESDILNVVRGQPGLKGREIAARLNADKAEVSSMLWKLQNRRLAGQNNAYRWFSVEKSPSPGTQTQQAPKQRTILGRLCRYYLKCLSLNDKAGVRVFARSQPALKYGEQPEVPGIITDQPVMVFAGIDDLFRCLCNDRERNVPYIGYPVRLKRGDSPKWEGSMFEPVFWSRIRFCWTSLCTQRAGS